MESSEAIGKLLEEIRDLQREQLAEYQRVTGRSLEMQARAVERQEQLGKLYRRVITVGAVLVAGLLILLLYLISKWPGLMGR